MEHSVVPKTVVHSDTPRDELKAAKMEPMLVADSAALKVLQKVE